VTYELGKSSARLDSNQRPPAPKAKEPTQLGAAGDRCPSFFLGILQFGATAGNREPLPIVSQLSAKRCLTIPFLTLAPTDSF
jgi:hypothetical protein